MVALGRGGVSYERGTPVVPVATPRRDLLPPLEGGFLPKFFLVGRISGPESSRSWSHYPENSLRISGKWRAGGEGVLGSPPRGEQGR